MQCSRCGDDSSPAESKFCEVCGSPLASLDPAVPVAAPVPGPTSSLCHCPPGESRPDADGYCENCGIRCVPVSSGLPVSNAHRLVEEASPGLAMVTDLGRKHPNNEDCGTVALDEQGQALLVVADGVSTSFHSAGAAAAAVAILKERLLAASTLEAAKATMASAIAQAHEAIMAQPAGPDPDLDGPESTLVAAKVCAEGAVLGWVGDSRAYLVGETAERHLTVDDSWIEEVVQAGLMTLEAANADHRSHCVTQVLGMRDDQVRIHVLAIALAPEDTLLLCSDGLWNYFQADGTLSAAVAEIRAKLGAAATASAVCQALVAAANAQGGHDNITVAIRLGV